MFYTYMMLLDYVTLFLKIYVAFIHVKDHVPFINFLYFGMNCF